MPYKFATDHKHLPEDKDRRRKLTREDRSAIRKLASSDISQRELARMFGVSRRTIYFVLHPDKLEENKQLRRDRGGWKQYYDRDKNTKTMREHRRYKQTILGGKDEVH